jgi:hypothetical protein
MSRANPRYHRNNPLGTSILPGNGAVRYRIIGSIEGQMTVCDFDYVSGAFAPTTALLALLLPNLQSTMFSKFKALISSDWTCTLERVDCIHLNSVMGVASTTNAGQTGGRGAGHEPTEVCQPMLKLTGLKGQHGRGRISIPAIATADVTSSAISAAAWTTAANTFGLAMNTAVTDGTNSWVPSVTTRIKPSPLAQYFAQQTGYRICTYLGTCRRRKIGRGR